MSLKQLSLAHKNSIIAFLKNQVSKKILKAISIILSPCCDNSISKITSTCISTNHVTLVIDLSYNVGLLGAGTASVNIGGTIYTGTYDNAGNVTLTNIALTGGSKVFTVTLFLPTNSSADLGTYMITPAFTYVVPTCT